VRDIVERAMHGDREAFGLLVGRTVDRMYAIATRILRDSDLAEDAVQTALIAAWRQLPGLRDPDKFEAWERKLVVHACYAEYNRRRRRRANVRALQFDDASDDAGLLSVAERDALDRAFSSLSVEQRAVFVLHHHVGLSLVEVGETLGIPAGTARSRLHYATRTLQAIVSDEASPAPSAEGRTA
jgi:RNA polymerase sigma factor (sigma-70 family)